MKPVNNACSRLVDRCAKMWRLDLIEHKYDCIACHDDELGEFWAAWTDETGVHYSDLNEGEAIRVYARFRIEKTDIIAWRNDVR